MAYPNDNFADAIELTGLSGAITPFHYDGVGDPATSETGEAVYGAGETLWWKWTAPTDCTVSFTTSGSPSDDSNPHGLDTKLQAFTGGFDWPNVLDSNDDGADVAYNYNSRVTFDADAGTTYYIQSDLYGSGEAGTLHLSWSSIVFTYGPWLTPPPQVLELTVTNDSGDGPGANPNHEEVAQAFVDYGTTWADLCEVTEAGTGSPSPAVGIRGKNYIWNPPAFIEYERTGEMDLSYYSSQTDDAMWANQFPFEPHFGTHRSGLANYSPSLPDGAVDIQYEGPTSYDPDTWTVDVEGRFLIQVNDARSSDYLEEHTATGAINVPISSTIQVRAVVPELVSSGAEGIWMPGAYLADQPLVWEQAVDATDHVVDSGWVPIDAPSLETRQLYLHHKEIVTHNSPAPATLPPREPPASGSLVGYSRLYYAAARWEGDLGFGTTWGDGDVRKVRLRFTWTSPRYRFKYTRLAPPLRQVGRPDASRHYPRTAHDGTRQVGQIP